jgi:hypothetical protein
MKHAPATRLTLALCTLLGAASCGDRALVVGEWIISRRGPDAGAGEGSPADASPGAEVPPPMTAYAGACVAPAPLPQVPVALPAQELARRLAWFMWRAPADDALVQRAAGVTSSAQVGQLADSMLNDARSRGGTAALTREWLQSDAALGGAPSPEVAALVTPELRQSMAEEPRLFMHELITDRRSTLTTLLTAPYTYADQRLATLYGAPPPASGFALTPLDPDQRAGVLTQPGLLMSWPKGPRRGVMLRQIFMCQAVPPPPANIDVPSMQGPGESYRTYFERITQQPACTACHALTEVGFALEHYDTLGRYRSADNGSPVNARAKLLTSDGNEAFVTGGPGLAAELKESCEVHLCVARSFLAYGLGRPLESKDDAAARLLSGAFAQAGFRLADLLLAVVQTPAFLEP